MSKLGGFDLVTSRPLNPEQMERAIAMAADEAQKKDGKKRPTRKSKISPAPLPGAGHAAQ